MLKDYALLFGQMLTLLFQASLKQGIVPNEWKTAYIVPIHKRVIQLLEIIDLYHDH